MVQAEEVVVAEEEANEVAEKINITHDEDFFNFFNFLYLLFYNGFNQCSKKE